MAMSVYEDKITQCEQLLHYQFKNKLFCLEALQTSGNPMYWGKQSQVIRKNENLAVLGDVTMKAHLCKKWYETGRAKGEWAVAEQAIVSNKNLSKLGFDIHLDACVFLNPGTSAVSDKTMSTTMAALIGAVFCDGGGDALGKLLETLKLDHENLRSATYEGLLRGLGWVQGMATMTAVRVLSKP